MLRNALRDALRPALTDALPLEDPIAEIFSNGEDGDFFDLSRSDLRFQESTKTTPAASHDDRVGALVGVYNGVELLQATAEQRETLKTDGTYWWIENDGTDDILESATNYSLTPAWYMALACQYAAGARSTADGLASVSASGIDFIKLACRQDVQRIQIASRGGALAIAQEITTSASNSFPDDTNAVVEYIWESGNSDGYVNASLQADGSNSWTNESIGSAVLGFSNTTGNPTLFVRRVYGGIFMNRIPTGAERIAIRSKLSQLSGVSL